MAENFRSPARVARRLKLLPLVAGKIKSWPSFMYHYALGLVPRAAYHFRNGARIKVGRGVDHVPIIEIFVRQDYGRLPDNGVILDLGANIGVFSVYAATTARKVRVYAYEPVPDFYHLMQENVRLNAQGEAIKCFNYAVAGESAERDLFVAGENLYFPTLVEPPATADARHIRVACLTLAEILTANHLTRVDVLKMDIEGTEYELLYGTPPEVLERIKEIRMEYHNLDSAERNVNGLKRFLSGHGFRVTHEQANSETNGNLWAQRQ